MKVCAQDSAVAEVDAPSGRRYRPDRGGVYDMSQQDARALVQAGGFMPSMAGTTAKSLGFRCPDCGHGSFFRTCGKCGGTCEREA